MPDYLYIIIGAAISLLALLISVATLYLIFILRDISKVVDEVEETVDNIKTYVMRPILLTNQIIKFIKPYIESAEQKDAVKKKK
jgi:uncharacterized protein YoxC